MKHKTITYEETGFFSSTVVDYLAGKPGLRPFYNYEPDPDSIPAIIKNIQDKNALDRSVLVKTLEEQYGELSAHPEVVSNIGRLADPKTFTVTTAHQLNIFTGPLYYIFKILNTVRATRDLNRKYPEFHFVPCYWMGSEDHDFEEINHIRLFNKELRWENFQGGSLGSYSTDGIADLIPEIREILRQGDHLDELMDIMAESYSRPTLVEAVRTMLNKFFGEFGLVVIDGHCRSFKIILSSVIKDELANHTSHRLAQDQTERLSDAGYGSQAGPREINLFLADGRRRERIVPTEDGFELADSGQRFSADELNDLVDEHPEYFSPNVILRPLHQQMVLPNIAYIGGGSEVAYWLQLKSIFDHYDVHFPMLLLRTSAQLFPDFQLNRLEKLGIELEEVFLSAETLKKNHVFTEHEDLELESEMEQLKEIYTSLKDKAGAIGNSLDSWLGAEEQKALNALENASKRLIKAAKNKDDQTMRQIDKLKDQILPDGHLQERRENFMSFYSDKGPDWFHGLLEILDPFKKKFYLIY